MHRWRYFLQIEMSGGGGPGKGDASKKKRQGNNTGVDESSYSDVTPAHAG